MRLLLTVVALSLSAPSWSSDPTNSPAQSAVPTPAKMVRPVNPDNYYPRNSLRNGEAGSPVVQACVDKGGKLIRQPVVTQTSGYPNLDAAALRVARDTRYAAGVENGSPASDRVAELVADLKADAGARTAAKRELNELLNPES